MPRRFLPVVLCVWLLAFSVPTALAALGAPRLFPENGAVAVCPDVPLRLTFNAAPTLAATGEIRIHDTATGTVVETFALGAPVVERSIGGLDRYRVFAVLVSDREVRLVPRSGALAYGRSYYVTMGAGAFVAGAETSGAINGPDGWRFSTRAAPPAAGSARLTVAADGTGDFCTVQGALDHIPEGNRTPVTVFVRRGVYREIVFFTGKHAVTVLGEDRRETVIAYANNAKFNGSGGNPFGGRTPNPGGENPRAGGSIYRRGLVLAHRVDDFTLANLTLWNTTPQGGSQAEALILNGTGTARAVVRGGDFRSFQDTVQINGQAFVADCFIEGDVDFMWGTGPAFFENCTARSLRSAAYYTQVRNPATHRGFVFLRCTFEGAPGVAENFLSRIEPHRFPHSEVVLVDCVLGPSVGAVGWQLQPAPAGTPPGATANLRFWEFNSRTPSGEPVDTGRRLPASRRLRLPEDAALVESYSDPTSVLGHGWQPRRAQIFGR